MPRGYRQRVRQSLKKMELMRKKKDRLRIERGGDYVEPFVPPLVRRRIIVFDYDFGTVRHDIICYKTNRIDSYQVAVDGKMQEGKKGWSAVCNLQRQAFVRVGSNYWKLTSKP